MGWIRIRTRTGEDAECLMRELAPFSPERVHRAIAVQLKKGSETDVLALLSAVETCLSANDIPSVRIELEGQAYMLEPRRQPA